MVHWGTENCELETLQLQLEVFSGYFSRGSVDNHTAQKVLASSGTEKIY